MPRIFAESRKGFREANFDISNGEEGGPQDRPLIVQFCANDPEQLLAAAKVVEPYCDAVDINLGCPQDIARRGHYGSFLQDDWDLVYSLINILHEISIPVTAKFRVFPSVEKTAMVALETSAVRIVASRIGRRFVLSRRLSKSLSSQTAISCIARTS